ncbi:MAG: glycosyltransferase family 2 protein [Pacificimonas sp.]
MTGMAVYEDAEAATASPRTARKVLPVSVLIPTFNRAAYLGEALDSIFAGTVLPAEIIVIDDGSTDETANVLSDYAECIEVIRQPNGGKSVALNRGLKSARQPYIWIFDDDDIATPDALQTLYDGLVDRPEKHFSFGDYDIFHVGSGGQRLHLPFNPQRADEGEELRIALMEHSFLVQPAMLVRRACYDELGPFDPEFIRSQDHDMLQRLARRYEGIRTPGVILHQRQHLGARGPAKSRFRSGRKNEYWLKFDQKIFRRIHAQYDLREYLIGGGEADLSPQQLITAYLQRFCVMGRKGLWDLALEDFKEAVVLMNRTNIDSLTASDLRITARAFSRDSLGAAVLPTRRFRNEMAKIENRSIRRIFRKILDDLRWDIRWARIRARYPNVLEVLRMLRFRLFASPSRS